MFVNDSTFNAGVSGTPISGDFDGDGKFDVAVFRASDGVWYILQSSAEFAATQFGQNSDAPAAGDYNGDGKIDLTVFRAGMWYFSLSGGNRFQEIQFGIPSNKIIK